VQVRVIGVGQVAVAVGHDHQPGVWQLALAEHGENCVPVAVGSAPTGAATATPLETTRMTNGQAALNGPYLPGQSSAIRGFLPMG
jgi:hypothetical protein